MGKVFSERSLDVLSQAHDVFKKVLPIVLRDSNLDFSIIESHRSTERQQYLYSIGRTYQTYRATVTNVDGIKRKSKHQTLPSHAVDLMIYTKDKSFRKPVRWDSLHFAQLAGQIQIVAKQLYDKGEIEYLIRWGGNWDNDDVISFDQKFIDMPHFEIYKP